MTVVALAWALAGALLALELGFWGVGQLLRLFGGVAR